MTVPDGIEPDKVTARHVNGVLEVTLPLPSGAVSRKVPIEIEPRKGKPKDEAA